MKTYKTLLSDYRYSILSQKKKHYISLIPENGGN